MLEFTVTAAAQQLIRAWLAEERDYIPVACIVKTTNPESGDREWLVGVYKRNDIPDDEVVAIGDLQLVIEKGWRSELVGYELDVVDGVFVVRRLK